METKSLLWPASGYGCFLEGAVAEADPLEEQSHQVEDCTREKEAACLKM